MWAVPEVSTAAAEALEKAVESTSAGLSDEATSRLLGMAAVPSCLQPLLKQVLLSKYGDLEAVWQDAELQKQLLHLPLQAMELLLSCDELVVESEDTVLFTATAYVKHLSDPQQQQAARQALAPLIRCQHLSQYWQTVSALSGDEDRVLLRDYAPQLQRLLLMRVANAPLGVTRDTIQASVVNKLLPAAPASWTLPRRNIVPIVADAATVSWRLPIKDVKSLVRETAEQREGRVLRAPNKTAPLKGMTFIPVLQSIWQNGQTKLLVGAGSVNVPKGAFYNFGFTCTVEGLGILPEEEKKTGLVNSEQAAGSRIAVLCDGWDAAAWAQTGLPASGDIVFKLTVTKVCHAL